MGSAQTVRPYPSLKAWRDAKDWTQQEAADFLGISQGQYSKLENGRTPRSRDLRDLMAKTGVPIEVLVGAA